MAKNDFYNTKVNILVLVTSAIGGIISWIISSVWLSNADETLPQIIKMGAVFAILNAAVIIMVLAGAIISGRFRGAAKNVLLPLLPGTLVVCLLAMLFQFIYGLSFSGVPDKATSYVFIIDDSGSNEDTDPWNLRYAAIKDVLSTEAADMPYMVYAFSTETEKIRDMGPLQPNEPDIVGYSEGDTRIKLALETVLADYNDKIWDGGENPKIVLLTDGYASDINIISSISKLLYEYVDNNLTVSTVGLGDCDERLLNEIADKTGGIYVSVENVNDLSTAMQKAARLRTERNLLSVRHMRRLSIVYGILRVLFLTLLGIIVGVLAAYAYGDEGSWVTTCVFAALTSLLGSLIMEIGTSIIHVNEKVAWFLLWFFTAITLVINRYKNIKTIDIHSILR